MVANLGFFQVETAKIGGFGFWKDTIFPHMKAELLENGVFLSVSDARMEIFEYIESYCNPVRKHSAFGYKSPDGFEKNHHQDRLNLQESYTT